MTPGKRHRTARQRRRGARAEFQARGLVHFYVIIRLDDPDGPDQAAP
ncbi:MAG TPA: hypothetical protein VIX85_02425 [Acidimicrobiales bacterium]